MTKHTPGPWKWKGPYGVEIIAPNVVTLDDDGGCDDPECCGDPLFHVAIGEADGHLIEAAPDLLEALTIAEAVLDLFGAKSATAQAALQMARAAIAKAEGTP